MNVIKIRYGGTGTVFLEGIGHVNHDETVEVPEALGKALTMENPGDWKRAKGEKPEKEGD